MSALILATAFAKQREELRLLAYPDSGGVWTVGYGATGPDIHEGTVWSEDQADANLAARMSRCEYLVRKLAAPLVLSDEQAAALMVFEDNAGAGALATSHLLQFVRERNWLAAAHAWAQWDHVGGIEVLGLLKRRYLEAAMFMDGC